MSEGGNAASGGGGALASSMRLVPQKAERVLNRRPAPVQLTAEQLMLEARAMEMEQESAERPQHAITDPAELRAYRESKRREFEEELVGKWRAVGVWKRYALFEEKQKEYDRARSVFERALERHVSEAKLWMSYAEMEIRGKFVARARNVLDRAVTMLPRLHSLWFKYAYLEEAVGNLNNARRVFERWMDWEPPEEAWLAYANFETRHMQIERARVVYERYVAVRPSQRSYLKLARWEERQNQPALARRAYERALDELRGEEMDERLFLEFAKFEGRCREFERARAVFRLGLEALKDSNTSNLERELVAFEKQRGSREDLEEVVIRKRREEYAKECRERPSDVDAWFDLIRLEETQGVANAQRVRAAYEEAVQQVPRIPEKRYWRRYVYLWLQYAVWEEAEAGDVDRARAVLRAALKIVPHRTFTFAKLWLAAANLEIRAKNLTAARKLLGRAIGQCPKNKLFREYIAIETKLGETDRVRKLYVKWLAFAPEDTQVWVKFAQMEASLVETERARAIYELALSIPTLEEPRTIWKAFIDFESKSSTGSLLRARTLYQRLITVLPDAKSWVSFARFEANVAEDTDAARKVFQDGYQALKTRGKDANEDRRLLRDAWELFETKYATQIGTEQTPQLQAVRAKKPEPRVVRKPLFDEAGAPAGYEEVIDWHFPDDEEDEKAKGWASLMRMARNRKKQA